jgi:Transketolase, thiamine diphosphate binding domain
MKEIRENAHGAAGDSTSQGQPPGMSLAERRGGNHSVIPDTTLREAEMSTTQEHSNIPSTGVEFAPITDVDLALAAELAQQLRVDSIRSSTSAGSGHPTSSMSAADLMAVLVGRHLRYDWDDPGNAANDHLIFSKGHASPLLYSIFKAVGVVSDEELMTGYGGSGRLGTAGCPLPSDVRWGSGGLGRSPV